MNIRDRLKNAVNAQKENLKGIKLPDIDLPDINLKEKAQETAGAAMDVMKNVKIPELKLPDIFGGVKENKAVSENSKSNAHGEEKPEMISAKSAVQIIYYLMSADGRIRSEEEENFDLIGRELYPKYQDTRDAIIHECQAQLNKVIDPEDYAEVLGEGIDLALDQSRSDEETCISPKLLLWDLLTVAYSDHQYDEAERRVIKSIVRKMNIDKTVFLEMESSIMTIMEVEREIAWLKTTDKPYLTIEAMINKLTERKNVIFESVKDLILL